jgi:hypothetical protein
MDMYPLASTLKYLLALINWIHQALLTIILCIHLVLDLYLQCLKIMYTSLLLLPLMTDKHFMLIVVLLILQWEVDEDITRERALEFLQSMREAVQVDISMLGVQLIFLCLQNHGQRSQIWILSICLGIMLLWHPLLEVLASQ